MDNINEIKKRLTEIINRGMDERGKSYEFYGFYAHNFNKVCDMRDLAEKLTDELMTAPADVKHDFMYIAYPYADNLRVCDTCGKFITEGYVLAGDYACSEKCAVGLYKGDYSEEKRLEMLHNDLQYDEENDVGDCYWTEW